MTSSYKERIEYYKTYRQKRVERLKAGPPELLAEYRRKNVEWVRNFRKRHPEEVKQRQRDYKKRMRDWMNEIKSARGCVDCGMNVIACLDFHHLDPSEKSFSFSRVRSLSKKALSLEIEKCIVLCSNCHRIRHSNSR